MLARLAAQQFKVSGLGQDAARVEHGGLGEDRRNLVAASVHEFDETLRVIPGQHFQCAAEFGGHTRAHGNGSGMVGRACQVHVDMVGPVHGVLPPVVVAFESDDQAPAGGGARQPHGGADGLGSGVGEPHLFDAGYRRDHLFCRFDLQFVGQSETGSALCDRLLDRRRHHRMTVAEDHGAQAEQIVDVGVAVDVAKARAGAFGHEDRGGFPAVAR